MYIRCDRGYVWWFSGDAGLLCPAEATRADSSTQRRAVQLTVATARHRLHRRPRTGAAFIRLNVVVSTATPAAAAGHITVPQSNNDSTQQRVRPTVFVYCVVSWWTENDVVWWLLHDAWNLLHFMYATWHRTPLLSPTASRTRLSYSILRNFCPLYRLQLQSQLETYSTEVSRMTRPPHFHI